MSGLVVDDHETDLDLGREIGHAPEHFDAVHGRQAEIGVPDALVLQEVEVPYSAGVQQRSRP